MARAWVVCQTARAIMNAPTLVRRWLSAAALLAPLCLANACRMPEAAVPTADELLIRPSVEGSWNGSGGFAIAAGWSGPAPADFDAAASSVSWTDGKDLYVGRAFGSGTALGVVKPPRRWRSDSDGLTWTTEAGELWNARPGSPPRLVWRYDPGRAESFALGSTAVFLALATGGAADGSALPADAPREIWRVVKATGEAARVAIVAGNVTGMVADGEDLFFAERDGRLRHVRGTVELERDGARKLTGLFGVDDRYVYGSDRSYLYRAPRDGGAATAIAHFGDGGATQLSDAGAFAALDGDQLYWIEGNGLFAAPTAGGRSRRLADFTGTVDRLVPAGDAIYVREFAADEGGVRVLRLPKRGTPTARSTPAGYERVFNFTVHGTRIFWLVGDKLWASDDVGEPTLLATLDHEVDSMLVADEAHVFFATADEVLWRVPALGGVPEKVADWQDLMPRPAPDGTTYCCTPAPTVALDAQNVFFVSASRGALARIPKGGTNNGGAQVLARNLGRPRSLRVDDSRAYVVADGEVSTLCRARLSALPKAGGPVTGLAEDLACGTGIALTTTTVWLASVGEPLKRVPKTGGPATILPMPAPIEVTALAGAGDTLYASIPSRILKLTEAATVPSVLVSGLRNPPTSMQIEGDTLFFIDARASKGIPDSRLQRVALQGHAP